MDNLCQFFYYIFEVEEDGKFQIRLPADLSKRLNEFPLLNCGWYGLSSDFATATKNIQYHCGITVIGSDLSGTTCSNIKKWSIMINSLNSLGLMVGVASSKTTRITEPNNHIKSGWFFNTANCKLYCPGLFAAPYSSLDFQIGTGSIIDILLDQTINTLSFCVNGISLGVGFSNLPTSTEDTLTFCAILFGKNDSITLLNRPFTSGLFVGFELCYNLRSNFISVSEDVDINVVLKVSTFHSNFLTCSNVALVLS